MLIKHVVTFNCYVHFFSKIVVLNLFLWRILISFVEVVFADYISVSHRKKKPTSKYEVIQWSR